MIEHIKNVGAYIRKKTPSLDIINGMVNTIDSKDMKYILVINILKNGIQYFTKEFEKDIVYDALFYQAGRGSEGGGIRLDFYIDSTEKDKYKKGRDKLKKVCEFCEVSSKYEEIREYIERYLEEKNKNTFVVLQVNGKMPKELFKDKFINKMYNMVYKGIKGDNVCHLCKKEGQGYNTVVYKFYTNDKGNYSNLNCKNKSGIIICQECLNDIIIAKKYIDEYLSTYWSIVEQNVMFLPHNYDENISQIYETNYIKEVKGEEKKVRTIMLNEEDLVEEVGKTMSITDIVFYKKNNNYFYIIHVIQSIMPSRFSFLGKLFKQYEIKLFTILLYFTAIKVSLSSIESTDKEKMRIMESIFIGRNIDRNLFFKRVMSVYKFHYLKDEHKKYGCMKNINKIYNFLCNCNCLQKGWNVMIEYKNYLELFEINKDYFDTNEKKAWFILGKAYDTMVYLIKHNLEKSSDNTNENDITSLEKNFFFARKFDYRDFIYFANLLTDKSVKYKIHYNYLQKMICDAKEYMARKENKLSNDEAKYLFFWGMDCYFKKEKQDKDSIKIKED